MKYNKDYEPISWQDEVKDASGNTLQEGTNVDEVNMNRMEAGIDLATSALAAIAIEALQRTGALGKELEKWQNQRLQQGLVTIYNKFVVDGAKISKMANSRYVQLSNSGTYAAGTTSRVFMDGKLNVIVDEQSVGLVPTNTGASSKTYYAYLLWSSSENKYKTYVADTVPENAMKLYRIVVPAGDQAANLDACTFYDERRVESMYPTFYSTQPFATVSIPGFPMLDIDHDVNVSLEDAADVQRVGDLIVYDKQQNGFKVKFSGNTDNVKIRWTIINPDLK